MTAKELLIISGLILVLMICLTLYYNSIILSYISVIPAAVFGGSLIAVLTKNKLLR